MSGVIVCILQVKRQYQPSIMGYETARFTSANIDKDLMCPICMCVLEKPVETPCEHSFCEACILQWLQTRRRCPLDNTVVGTNQLCEPSRLLTNQLGRLEIACDFRAEGCTERVPLEYLAAHRLKCPHNPRPGQQPRTADARAAVQPRQGRPAYHDQYEDDDIPSGLEAGLAVGAVAMVGAAIGAVVGGIIGYKRGRNRTHD
ncbi:E3 ubiquitin-protein ligase NRDP1-like isoform X2 [Amphibalanus amphitrite]|uniref:E3 ubiquitin-protein ligase NRDP1-like isoform X2 n=2 Tax=Amphibalanus amphitrite TaxID=1232801 RepID=UPI001C8FE537|nr:E3 ubiquitin-protein ligase NRDP1-like isoform X2 [Amphibalanus amphitrite]